MTMTEHTENHESGEVNPVGPVLVGIDFSQDSEAALLWANKLAVCFSAPLMILHVVHDPAEFPGFYRRKQENKRLPTMEAVAREMMEEFISRMIEKHAECENIRSIPPRFVTGLPAGRIIEIAKDEKATMIVIGSRGLTGLPHLLLGSTADRVVQLSRMPVTVVKHRESGV